VEGGVVAGYQQIVRFGGKHERRGRIAGE